MALSYGIFFLLLSLAVFLSVKAGKLTLAGGLTGGVIGILIFLGAGLTGIAMIGLFFGLGVVATSWKMNVKQALGAEEKNKGRRTAGQVLANGGTAGLLGLLTWIFPEKHGLFTLMMAAGLASATADTLSSELGTVYGRRFYNILTFRKDARGANGVVSLEGTLIGVGGSTLIAAVHAAGCGWSQDFIWIVVAGTLGNITDSVLGATLERAHYLNNDAVNTLNTIAAALFAGMLSIYF